MEPMQVSGAFAQIPCMQAARSLEFGPAETVRGLEVGLAGTFIEPPLSPSFGLMFANGGMEEGFQALTLPTMVSL